jgi:hypothetical protein
MVLYHMPIPVAKRRLSVCCQQTDSRLFVLGEGGELISKQAGTEKVRIMRDREGEMALRWLLFETRIGEMLLAFLERKVGLAVVHAEWLALQPGGEPKAVREKL